MLKSIADQLDSTKRVLNWLKRESPNEEIVFAFPAKVIESRRITPATWYQRLSERSVIFIVTKEQMALKSVLISPVTILYLLTFVTFFTFSMIGRQWSLFLLSLLSVHNLVEHLQYQHKILYKGVRKLLVDTRGNGRTEFVIDIETRVFHVRFAQSISPKSLRLIASRTKIVMTS